MKKIEKRNILDVLVYFFAVLSLAHILISH
jgi:hypothetical protein